VTARRRSRPRVLLVHFTTPGVLGGVEQVMGTHALGLRDAGADVVVVAGRGALTRAQRGIRLVRIPELDSKHRDVLATSAALARGEIPPSYARLRDRIERALRPLVARADRVVVHNALTLHKNHALAAAVERLASGRPRTFLAWTHDLGWTDAQYAGELHEGEPWERFRRPIRNVRYVAVSAERRDEACRLLGLRRKDMSVVVNGVDVPAILGLSSAGARLAERLGLYDADPLLLLPARLTRRKRIEAAIAAAAALRAGGAEAGLVITGAPGAHNVGNRRYLAELREQAAGVAGVHLLYALGVRPSYRVVADLYALADVLVLPTGNEGFGIPLIEAGLHRLPIVCTDLPALRELAGDDATYLAADADGAAIARAIVRRLRDDPEARLRSRAKRHAWPRVLRERVIPVILEDAA
jgi:glycosyltransferase involved in cell wall biosynthesis